MPGTSKESASRVENRGYAPPGHVPVIEAGTEVVDFSPSGEYEQTMEVVARNLAAMQAS